MSLGSYVLIILLVLVALAVGYVAGRSLTRSGQEQQKDTFKALAGSVLSESTTEFLKLAEEKFKALAQQGDATLEEKKKLIDANLQEMGTTLRNLVEKSARLDEGLATSKEETEKLRSTAEKLRQVLASPQQRGKWGERMVEDILNVMGLQKGINYQVQLTMSSGERPDYTFFLPKDKKINLDVKFPIDQYERYIEAGSAAEAENARKQFLSDVKNHVKAVSSRGYIDPESGTVDYVMVFIPNESIYGFIHQNDPELLDYALANHIILCSPITLYAVLSLIHQAVRNFAMEERAGEFMLLLEQFSKQWGKYVEQMDKLGRSLESAQRDYQAMVTTRSRQLEKPLAKILELQEGRPEELAGGVDE